VVAGNADYLTCIRPTLSSSAGGVAKARKSSSGEKEAEFVMFRGSLVDLESLMDKLETSDVVRTQLENKLVDMTQQLGKS
jgi:hypothetical protein